MRRPVLTIAAALSLLLCIASSALWLRSQFAQDSLWRVTYAPTGQEVVPVILTDNGRLAIIIRRSSPPAPNPGRAWTHMARQRFPEFEDVRWFAYSRDVGPAAGRTKTQYVFRLAPLAILSAILPLMWLRQFQRNRNRPTPGHCHRCRYDLTGNSTGICPECGTAKP